MTPVSATLELLLVEDVKISPDTVTIYNHPDVRVSYGITVPVDRHISTFTFYPPKSGHRHSPTSHGLFYQNVYLMFIMRDVI